MKTFGRLGHSFFAVCALAAVLFNGGCSSMAPQPAAKDEVLASSRDARAEAVKDVAPISRALTLDEAIARALKYNLHERARRIEQAIALNLWSASNYDMLPRVLASAGYRSRSNDLITRSRDSVTGLPSLANPYISTEREYEMYDLGLSWSVLDFSVSYFTAKQNANRLLIAAEQRRKAMHALSRDVSIAFWRMASAQRLLEDVRATVVTAEAALAESVKAQQEGLRAPIDSLRFQRQMLENVRLLSTIEKDFATARTTLGNLINAPFGSEFTVVEPTEIPNITILDVPTEQMEEIAILQNADLKEQFYNQRIARDEVKKTMAKMLPNLSLNLDARYNTDSFLINNNWREAGLVLSQNLTNLLAAPSHLRLAEGGVALARQRAIALQMALLAQVRIARLELASTYRQLRLADRIWDIDQALKKDAENKASAQTESMLTKVAADTATIVSMLRRYQALADFNVSFSTLQSTLGMEIDLNSVESQSIEELTASISRWRAAWQEGRLPPAATEPINPETLRAARQPADS